MAQSTLTDKRHGTAAWIEVGASPCTSVDPERSEERQIKTQTKPSVHCIFKIFRPVQGAKCVEMQTAASEQNPAP